MTKIPQAAFAGMTDYSAVGLPDLVSHLRDWKARTDDVLAIVAAHRITLGNQTTRLTRPRELDSYIGLLESSFQRYSEELSRLIKDIPKGVTTGHAESLRQVQRHCWRLNATCRTLRDEDFTKEEDIRFGPIEQIYTESRSFVQDFADMSNLASRLDVLIGQQCRPSVAVILFGSTQKLLLWAFSIFTALLIAWLSKLFGLI